MLSALWCVMLLLAPHFASAEEDVWPRFRGPNGEGHSNLSGLPSEWTADDYEWTIKLPGKGHSSPAVWKDKLFLTAGIEDGTRELICLNALTGESIWTETIKLDASHLHNKSSYGSCTPAVDGEQVYITVADEEHYVVAAYNFAGKQQWTTDLGTYSSEHGYGSSPIVHGELVIVPNDQKGPSFIIALDRKTGKEVWKTERDFRRTAYSTPFIFEQPGKEPQVVCLCGNLGLTALDPKDGKTLWSSGQMQMRTVASPIYGNGVIIATCGSGGSGKQLVAVDPTGNGDVSRSHIKYEQTTNVPYVPTGIVKDELLFLWHDGGVVRCIEMATGKDVWAERVGGKTSGSPVLVDGKLYCIAEDGTVNVIAADRKFQLLGQSSINDDSYATPAIANGRMYLRGFGSLSCLKAKP